MKYACLVMDHDDTAVQSEATVNYPFFEMTIPTFCPGAEVSLKKYTAGCYELGFAQMCRQWYGFTDKDLEEEFRGWQSYVRTHVPLPYPGIRELLEALKAQGHRLYVATSKPEVTAIEVLEYFDLAKYFDGICGASLDQSRTSKSDVIAFLLDKFGTAATPIMVGDTAFDVIGAAAHGIPTIGVSWGYGTIDDLKNAGAFAIADTPEMLLNLLNR